MKLRDMDIKEKTKMVVDTIVKAEDGTYHYFDGMLHTFNNDDKPIIKSKMDNLVVLLEKSEKDGNYDEFVDLDFEEEIWDMI